MYVYVCCSRDKQGSLWNDIDDDNLTFYSTRRGGQAPEEEGMTGFLNRPPLIMPRTRVHMQRPTTCKLAPPCCAADRRLYGGFCRAMELEIAVVLVDFYILSDFGL